MYHDERSARIRLDAKDWALLRCGGRADLRQPRQKNPLALEEWVHLRAQDLTADA
jgi:hypothetical protein